MTFYVTPRRPLGCEPSAHAASRESRNRGKFMRPKAVAVATFAFIAALVPAVSEAVSIGFCSGQLEGLGQCTKTVAYDLNTNILTLTLANTSPAANGGFLTADAFNLDAQVVSFTGDADFTAFALNPGAPSSGGNINVSPFGTREFVISATNGLGSEEEVQTAGSRPAAPQPLPCCSADITEASLFGLNEVIRFRGFENGGSDKTRTEQALVPVPEPGTLLLLGSALVGMGIWSQKRLLSRFGLLLAYQIGLPRRPICSVFQSKPALNLRAETRQKPAQPRRFAA